jgi:hypothetical protein
MPKTISIKLHNPDGTSVTIQVPADRSSAAAEQDAAE